MNNIELINKISTTDSQNEISIELVCSSVLSFVKGLPQSIDPMNDKFIPGILFNAIPDNYQNYSAFNEEDGITLFSIMKNWRDSRKAAYSIQVCLILQSMLLDNKEISLEHSDNLISGLLLEDSDKLKETLYKLNDYFKLITNSPNIEEREKYIEEFYQLVKSNYGNCSAYNDLKMFYYFFHLPSDIPFTFDRKNVNNSISNKKIKIMKNN